MYIKRDVVGVRALGKSKCRSDTREPRPHNRISVTIYLNIGLMVCDMFPTPQPQNWQFMSPVHQVTLLHLVAPNGFFPGVVVTCGEEREPGRFPVGEKRGKIGVWRCGLWPDGEGHE